MKYFITPLAIIALLLTIQSCNEDPEVAQRTVTIGFTLSSESDDAADAPANSRLFLSIQSHDRSHAIDLEEIDFQSTGTGFVTRLPDLPFGSYTITDFILVSEQGDMIYAVPRGPGGLCNTIDRPLDYNFKISSGMSQNIHLQLLDVRNHKPADFGYSSFRKPGRRLGIVVTQEGTAKPTSAQAFIINANDTLASYDLAARMNHIALPADVTEDYKLSISKSGYASVQYLVVDLIQSKGNKPLKVSLTPAFTMLAYQPEIGYFISPFRITLRGPDGSPIAVDWGDGTHDTYQLNAHLDLSHSYTSMGNYPVTITGDIDKITYFYSFYGKGMIDEIDFQHLTDLKEIRFGLTRSPGIIDLSHNTKLEWVMLGGLHNLAALYLPDQHQITYLDIGGPNQLATPAVDAVVNNLFRNTVEHDTRNGEFALFASWPEENDLMVGPPSSAAMEKIQALKEDYNWTIYPDPFD